MTTKLCIKINFILITSLSLAYSSDNRGFRSVFSLFDPISIDNNECQTSDTNSTTFGTCYTPEDCTQRKGVSRGECADGYGVCCVFENMCGNLTNANVSYFVNPFWPKTFNEPFSCTLKVSKVSQKICQLRVDFVEFEIANPVQYKPDVDLSEITFGSVNSESNCKEDMFIVTQSNRNQPIPILCGKNKGQHLFIPVDESDSNVIAFTFLTGIVEMDRKWKLKITQLPCSLSPEQLAPQGCLQYYNTNRGLIKTFNFDGKHYLQNIDYSICIRKPKNMCYLTLTAADLAEQPKVMTNYTNASDSTIVERIGALVQSEARPLVEPIQVGDPNLDRMPTSFFDTSEVVLPLRGRMAFSPRRTSRRDSICQSDHYWITYPGSNRICSYDTEPFVSPITIATNSHQVIHFHSSTWTQSKLFSESKAIPKGFVVNYAHSPCTHLII